MLGYEEGCEEAEALGPPTDFIVLITHIRQKAILLIFTRYKLFVLITI